jgi:hypothetical protein
MSSDKNERKLDAYVQMPWVTSGAQIIDNNFDDVAVVCNKWVDLSVEGCVVPQSLGGGQSSIQRGHLLWQISLTIDKATTRGQSGQ